MVTCKMENMAVKIQVAKLLDVITKSVGVNIMKGRLENLDNS